MVKIDSSVDAFTKDIAPLSELSNVTVLRLFPLPVRLMPVLDETTKLYAATPEAPPRSVTEPFVLSATEPA